MLHQNCVRAELNAVNTLPVHDLSAVNDCTLRFKYSSTAFTHARDPGCGTSRKMVGRSGGPFRQKQSTTSGERRYDAKVTSP